MTKAELTKSFYEAFGPGACSRIHIRPKGVGVLD